MLSTLGFSKRPVKNYNAEILKDTKKSLKIQKYLLIPRQDFSI